MSMGEALSRAIDRGDFNCGGDSMRALEGGGPLRVLRDGDGFKGLGSGKKLRILISERDPLCFLQALAETLCEEHHVFLANPDWKRREWLSVEEQVEPDAIWRDGVLSRWEKKEVEIDFPAGDAVYIGIPTGGTGGQVRFALHTESTLAAAVEGFRQFFNVERIHSTCLLPLFHVSGLMQVMRALFTEGSVCFAPSRFLEGNGLTVPADREPAFLSLVPTQLRRFLGSPGAIGRLKEFHAILLGGAPASPELLEAGRQAGLRLAPTYGMTETAAAICALRPEAFLDGGVSGGEVFPHVRIAVVAREDGIASSAEEGRLFIESASLFKGYFPDVNPSLHQWESGDLGCFTENGHLHVTGRVRPTINSGGEKVDPEEVERVLLASGGVKEAHVTGVPDEEWGEAVAALFVPAGSSANAGELAGILRLHLAPYKIPKLWIPLDRLPRNAQGKLDRARIEKELNLAKGRR